MADNDDGEYGGALHAATGDDVEATVRLKLNEDESEGGGDDVDGGDGDGHFGEDDEGESESQSGASSSVGGERRKKKRRDKKKKSKKKEKERKRAKREKKKKKRSSDETADDDEEEDPHQQQQEVDEESEEQQEQQPGDSNEDFDIGAEELRERCDMLENLPVEITERFLEVGFGRWDKNWLPVLELGPFDVKGGVRDQWMSHYQAHIHKERGRVMPRLIYWYGVPKERANEAFSFLPPKSVVPYEEGLERGLNKVPKKIQSKVDRKKNLSKAEKDIILGLQQIAIDCALPKDDRMAWMKDPTSSSPPKKTKKKKGAAQRGGGRSGAAGPGKTAKEDGASAMEDPNPTEREKDAGGTKKKRKQTPKSKKGKRQKTDDAVPPPEDTSQVSEEPPPKEEKSDHSEEPPPKEEKADHSTSFDHELSEDEERADEEPDEEDEYKAEDEEDGEDEDDEEEEFEPERKDTKRKRLSKGKPAKKKVAKAKAEVEEDDGLTEEERNARDKKRLKDRHYRARLREQKRFTENEKVFLPEMRKLEGAVERSDADAAINSLLRLESLIPDITPSFIEGYGIGLLVKRTRTSFESKKAIKSKCKGITNAMKEIYNDKKKDVPPDFKPKKSIAADAAREQQPKAEKSVDSKKKLKKESSAGKPVEKSDPSSAEIPKDSPVDAPIPVKGKVREQGRQPSEAVDVTTGGTSQASSRATPVTESSARPSQPSRKAFSLKTMLHGPKPAVASKSPGVPPDQTASSVTNASQRGQRQQQMLPAWLTEVSEEDPPGDDLRKFAIELLETTGQCFPTDTINHRAFVLNIEAAVYALSRKKSATNFTEHYWDKITEVVGAIKGKFVTGTIAKEIAEGNFPTAEDLAKLESNKFYDSFEGL